MSHFSLKTFQVKGSYSQLAHEIVFKKCLHLAHHAPYHLKNDNASTENDVDE